MLKYIFRQKRNQDQNIEYPENNNESIWYQNPWNIAEGIPKEKKNHCTIYVWEQGK
jgi:hypothetical protein